ncbi:acid ceramidase isoform X2 [Folsomia candida]|uniref:acid ceramidase isoform X2 n=1 Tax=Folsomia candida TaxID=158441 RepID=UPI000B9029F1|nr:acid ceramidase isoform X2 [Folsomia candida]
MGMWRRTFLKYLADLQPTLHFWDVKQLYSSYQLRLPPPDEYLINLDLPPEYRWVQVAEEKGMLVSAMLNNLKNYTLSLFGGELFSYVDALMPLLGRTLPPPFRDEMRGMSEISGIPFGELVLYNVFYELFTVCTSILAQDTANDLLFHARNLDFGLFLGWDAKNQTWLTTEFLRPLVIKLTFTRGNRTIFQSVNFAGYIGILTGLKKDAFSLTINERFNIKGGFFGVLEWILGKKDIKWLGFLTREVMENATSYEEAKALLTKSALLAPAYYILGGVRPGQACVITRGQRKADVLSLGLGNGGGQKNSSSNWYLVQTNYDHWKEPPFWDDRRKPAITCMDKFGPKEVGFSSLYNVLSTRPVFNKLTTYTALMQVATGEMEIYIKDCHSPCWPW